MEIHKIKYDKYILAKKSVPSKKKEIKNGSSLFI